MSDNYITKEEILSFVEEMEKRTHGDDLITKTVLVTTKCVKDFVMHMPPEDVRPVVHCSKCKHWDERQIRCNKHKDSMMYGVHDYCSKGKRKGADE